MRLPSADEVSTRIRYDPKLYPFFKDCLGAIDGTHINVYPPATTRARWRDRHGDLSQNILAICDFTMRFVFFLVGWEGSVADSTLYNHAIRRGGLTIPEGMLPLCSS